MPSLYLIAVKEKLITCWGKKDSASRIPHFVSCPFTTEQYANKVALGARLVTNPT